MAERERVVCGEHGETPLTFACVHVAEGVACGVHTDDDSDTEWPDAWCDLCEDLRVLAGGWTEEASEMADIKPLCTYCYREARARNEVVPPFARGRQRALDDDEQTALIDHAQHLLKERHAAVEHEYALSSYAKWWFDDESRTLRFTDPAKPTLVADIRMVGSYSKTTSTYQWSWATYDDSRVPIVGDVACLRWFGAVRNFDCMQNANWPADEIAGWEMGAIAAYLLGAQFVYRAPFDHLYWWMLLDHLRLVS